jgi:hypothetical protein
MGTNRVRAKGVHMESLLQSRPSSGFRGKEVEDVRPQVIGVRAKRGGSLATEQQVLNAAPASLSRREATRRIHRRVGDVNLAILTVAQPMHWQGTPVH